MTKKDYIRIARAVSRACCSASERLSVAAEIGSELAQDNSNFNYTRFRDACFEGNEADYNDLKDRGIIS